MIKKFYCKFTSVLLCLTLILSFICFDSLKSFSACNHTNDEAMAWVTSKVGTSIDVDNAYGCQCVDFIMAYYDYLLGYHVYGNGRDYATNTLPTGWTRISGGTPQIGDILVYYGPLYGHVAIYGGTNIMYHQNWSGQYVEKSTRAYNKGWYSSIEGGTVSYWGIIRPDWSTITTATFTKTNVGVEDSVVQGNDITITGVVTCNVYISYAHAYLLDGNLNKIGMYGVHPGTKSYDLSNLNSLFSVANYAKGKYYLEVYLNTPYGGCYAISKYFYVTGTTPDWQISNNSVESKIVKGTNLHLKGSATCDYMINYAQVSFLDSNLNLISKYGVYPKSHSFDFSTLNSYFDVSGYSAGKYYVEVVLTTTGGSKYPISQYFYVINKNKLSINYYTGGGTLGNSSYVANSSGLISPASGVTSTMISSLYYGDSIGEYGFSNATNGLFNMTKAGYYLPDGAEWKADNGATFDQDITTYTAAGIAENAGFNLENGAVSINLYPNWKPYKLTIVYNTNGGSVLNTADYSKDTNGNIIKADGSATSFVYDYGTVIDSNSGLKNVNSSTFNCAKTDYYVDNETAWITDNGATFNHNNTHYTAQQIAQMAGKDLTTGNVTVTLKANWKPDTYMQSFNVNHDNTETNLFYAETGSAGGENVGTVTRNYDATTSILTLNGTISDSFSVGRSYMTFEEGEKYLIQLEYVSGSFTCDSHNLFATDIKKMELYGLSERNVTDLKLPTSSNPYYADYLVVNSAGAADGKMFYFWIWRYSGSFNFDNYKIKVKVTKAPQNEFYCDSSFIEENSDVTGTFDSDSEILTLDGSNSASFLIGNKKIKSFAENEQYKVKLEYISGTATSKIKVFVTDVISQYGAQMNPRNNLDLSLPTEENPVCEAVLTINSASVKNGEYFKFWIWTNAGEITFDNYKIKVSVTKISNAEDDLTGSVYKKYGSSVTFPEAPEREGYNFLGWSTSTVATTAEYKAGETYIVSKSNRFFAVWELKKYIVDYSMGDSTLFIPSEYKTYGNDYCISDKIPTKSGSSFVCWQAIIGDNVVNLFPGDKIKANEDISLYAVFNQNWEENTFWWLENDDSLFINTGGWVGGFADYNDTPWCDNQSDITKLYFAPYSTYILGNNFVKDANKVTDVSASYESLKELKSYYPNAEFHISNVGDIDNSYSYDINDFQEVVNLALKNASDISEKENTMADMNEDGVVDVLDAMLSERAVSGNYKPSLFIY